MTDPRSRTPISRAERRAAAKLRELEIQEEIRRRRAQASEEAEQRRLARKQRRAAAKSFRRAEWWRRARERAERLRRALILVSAIVGVNAVAIVGQVSAFTTGFGWDLIPAIAAASVVESVAIYVGWHAHVALIEGDTVLRLRFASYAIAAGVGALNYHHYAGPDWAPTDQAVMFGAASLLSPWLWAMHSRHVHRTQLRTAGLIDPRAPKFGVLRWVLHRSETWRALRWAIGEGEQSPTVAVLAVRAQQTEQDAAETAEQARRGLDQTRDGLIKTQRTALTLALNQVAGLAAELDGPDPHAAKAMEDAKRFIRRFVPFAPSFDDPETRPVAETSETAAPEQPAEKPPSLRLLPPIGPINPGSPWATGVLVPLPRPAAPEQDPEDDREDRPRPTAEDNENARAWVADQIRATGQVPTKASVAGHFGFSPTWALNRIHEAKHLLAAEGWTFPDSAAPVPPASVASVNGSAVGA